MQLIGGLYPALDDNLRTVVVGDRLRDHAIVKPDVMNRFMLELYPSQGSPVRRSNAPSCSDPVVSAQFTFDWQTENKELIDLRIFGPAIGGRREQFAKEVDKHPEWSDAKVVEAMNEAGAKYGPDHKAEFLRSLPLGLLKVVMGGEIEERSADFEIRPGTAREAIYGLRWSVRTKWRSPDGREAGCNLMFEPFEGNLESIYRDALPPKAGGEPGNGPKRKVP